MTPRWQRIAAPPPESPLFMDAELTPHRSLSRHAFKLLIGAFAGINIAIALYFIEHGAYPVVGFLGLDVLGVWLAFHLNYRAARQAERVQVAAGHVHLERRSPRGADHWIVAPTWAKARRVDDGVRIFSGKESMRVGAFLSPAERADFARAMNEALWRANHRPSTSRIE